MDSIKYDISMNVDEKAEEFVRVMKDCGLSLENVQILVEHQWEEMAGEK